MEEITPRTVNLPKAVCTAYKRSSLTLTDAYVNYLERLEATDKIPDSQKEKYRIHYNVYRAVMTRLVELIVADILRGRPFVMPYKLGRIMVDKKRTLDAKKLRVDWKATMEHNMKIFHLNEHSNGYYYRIRWDKEDAVVPNKYRWSFVAASHIKKKLSNVVRSGKTFVSYGH
jgi:hypothetical protein